MGWYEGGMTDYQNMAARMHFVKSIYGIKASNLFYKLAHQVTTGDNIVLGRTLKLTLKSTIFFFFISMIEEKYFTPQIVTQY